MSRDTASFSVVDLDGCDLSDLSSLNIEKAAAISMDLQLGEKCLLDIMGAHMDAGPE